MNAKEAIAWLCMAFGITAAALSGAYLLMGLYWYALIGLIVVVLCMETRVRLGYRNTRKALFFVHVAASVMLLGALYGLTRLPHHVFLSALAYTTYVIMAVSGGILLHRTHTGALRAKESHAEPGTETSS